MAKPVLKLFPPFGSPIIPVSSDPCTDTNSKGTLSAGSQNTPGTGVGKFAILDLNCHLSCKRCETGRWLLWNINRKSWAPDQMVSFSMTSSDLWPGFQGHDIFRHWISPKWHMIDYYRMSIGSHMHSIEWWHFQWPWRTPNPIFKVTAFLKSNISNPVHLRDKLSIEY